MKFNSSNRCNSGFLEHHNWFSKARTFSYQLTPVGSRQPEWLLYDGKVLDCMPSFTSLNNKNHRPYVMILLLEKDFYEPLMSYIKILGHYYKG